MPVSEPSSTLAGIVWPDASVLESAGSTILNAYASPKGKAKGKR